MTFKYSENDNCDLKKPNCYKNFLFKRLHILQWLPWYTKFDAVSDLIAGITVGLTLMPQSMAYAALANLPPQYGLYSSFMGSLIYVFFGTIKEVSIGATSLMALLTFSYTRNLPIDYIFLLCFLAGWVELLMGVFRLGFIVDFISAPAISGFTSATACIIIMTQLKGLFGIKFASKEIVDFFLKFGEHLPETRREDLMLGVCSIVCLLIFRKFKDVKPKNKALGKIFWTLSVGRNALIVLITSVIAFYYDSKYGQAPFTLTGKVTPGVPSFHPPAFKTKVGNETVEFFDMVQTLGSGIVILPVVAVLANVAIAKSFASGKIVDATQEMLTLGLCNIIGSFVQSMPTCGAFTRSAVANASGMRTPMGGIYAGTIILFALTFLTPYFRYVPRSTLSAVLISAVMFMIDFEILPKLWKSNKFDLLITVITFSLSLVYGVELGLFIGVAIGLYPLIKSWTRPKIESTIFIDAKGDTYILFKPQLGLYFSAVDYLSQEIVKGVLECGYSTVPIVIDFTGILNVDYTAVQALDNLVKTFERDSHCVMFLNVNDKVLRNFAGTLDISKLCICQNMEEISGRMLELKACKDAEAPSSVPLLVQEKFVDKEGKTKS